MYLACADEHLNEAAEKVKETNQLLVDSYHALPFWKRSSRRFEEVCMKVIQNWRLFELWQQDYILKKRYEDHRQVLEALEPLQFLVPKEKETRPVAGGPVKVISQKELNAEKHSNEEARLGELIGE